MARASRALTDWTEVPHEPGNAFRFRMLTHIQLEEAEDVVTDRTLSKAREVVDLSDIITRVAAARSADPGSVTITGGTPDPATRYDRATVCRYGIAEWRGPAYGTDPVAADDLDARTAEWAAREIIRHSIPTDESVGKDSSRSTGTSTAPVPPPTGGT